MKKKINDFLNKHQNMILILGTIIYELIMYIIGPAIKDYYLIFVLLGFFYLVALFIIINDKNTWKKNIFYLIYILGVTLKTIYIFKTSVYERQHDVLTTVDYGHLGYIYYIYINRSLPLINTWQFYHPPLWHFIGALWLHLKNFLKINFAQALEGLQIITLLLSSFSVIIVNEICKKLKFSNFYRQLTNLIFAVHPFFILMSGHINNDMLLLFLQLLIVLLLINYQEEKSIKNIVCLAFATGFCVMTKLNGAIMAVPILFIFIKELIETIKKDKAKIKTFFLKMFIFGSISLPIGLWHQVRNILLFGKNIVPEPGLWLYRGDLSFYKRFIKISLTQLFRFAKMHKDYNLPTFIIKSSIFGEYSFDKLGVLATAMILFNIALIITSLICMFLYFKKKKTNTNMNMLFITWLTTMVSMVIFYIKYPYACSMDFRYMSICLLPGMLFLNYITSNLKSEYIKMFVKYLTYGFSILSIIFVFLI